MSIRRARASATSGAGIEELIAFERRKAPRIRAVHAKTPPFERLHHTVSSRYADDMGERRRLRGVRLLAAIMFVPLALSGCSLVEDGRQVDRKSTRLNSS